MEAQRYPEDYDGIIAGDPANDWTHFMTSEVKNSWVLTHNPASWIPPNKLPAIQNAALAACDKADGVADGVVENPGKCRFDPAVLLCTGQETSSCLTAQQMAAIKEIYGGLHDAGNKLVFPGYAPSGEAGRGGWGYVLTGPAPGNHYMHAFSTGFFKYMVYGDASWDYKSFDVARDLPAAQELAGLLNATDPNLKAFHARGGKLILYHGWCDPGIPAQATIDYYQSVVRKMGSETAGKFVRLFLVPGMQHCWGGPGPNQFGQDGPPTGDPASNLAAALMQWVEKGVAPNQIVAVRAGRTRPLCAYPKTARYKGSGSTDDAANFECAQ